MMPSDPGFDLIPTRFRESTCDVPTPTSLSVQSPQGKKLFIFDRVFPEDTSQEGVWEYVSDAVPSFVKGYNVSIIAYGQSGAGKSYTMGTSGPEDQSDANFKGIVPRAARMLFDKLNGSQTIRQSGLQTPKRYSTSGLPSLASISKPVGAIPRNWELKATYVEIYNEQLRDLLAPESIPLQDRAQVIIREDTKGRIMLTGLTQVPINSVEDVLSALNFGSAIRQTDATAMNARSSRSHAVFSLNLVQKRAETPRNEKRMSMPVDGITASDSLVTIDSKLHFVDLAGSERLKNTQATGDRAKEGISINAGLASLGKVISQLSSKHGNAHISYRDSRLTRLLQDSLGGNAITFMIACVTPASFHLSETLNTVHYAQRARAIQSKPEIQQSHEDSDKQAAIDRLRAEVSFLRDQIRHTEQNGGKGSEKNDRADRLRGREADLQTELLDMQENYNALSQRHARLITEISKARDGNSGETPLLTEAMGENASERIKRSNSFAEAVEQVVLEYEKTIQSLEVSLSKTRSNLSNTESALLEKETRLAYMDTIQQQLQTRVQKYMDREQSNESYTRDLERKMEGATTQEERNGTMVAELQKELARVREGESGAEDYISTLEERLAEAEQDQEIMQREIERLEHVVERQRSIGRLDNLLDELDGIRQIPPKTNGDVPHTPELAAKVNGNHESYDPFRPQSVSSGSNYSDYDVVESRTTVEADEKAAKGSLAPSSAAVETQSPAQNDFMAEKLESLTQEFFDLRSEHESVVVDYDNLQQKYRTALETLAKLEYDQALPQASKVAPNGTPQTFLADAGMKDEEKVTNGQPSSSHSQSLELSLLEDQNTGAEADAEKSEELAIEPTQVPLPDDPEELQQEVEMLRKMQADSEESVTELTKKYLDLTQKHELTLAQLEELRMEMHRTQHFRPSSPVPASPVFTKSAWRRKSGDLLSSSTDQASRSLTSLKVIALDHFDQSPDVRRNFDTNLNNIMNELQARTERIQGLEVDLANIKKEMENKQTIISGLTRERSSLAASTAVDFSVVGQLQEQLIESENQIRSLHQQHAEQKKEFEDQIDDLKSMVAEHQKVAESLATQLPTPGDEHQIPGEFPITPAEFPLNSAQPSANAEDMVRLQQEITTWESKHKEAMATMTESEANLLSTISNLEESLEEAERRASSPATAQAQTTRAVDSGTFEQRENIDSMQEAVLEYQVAADTHLAKLEDLQRSYTELQKQVEESARSRHLAEKQLKAQKDLVANLEDQLVAHKSSIAMHQENLQTLQTSHAREIDGLRESMTTIETQSRENHAAQEQDHREIAAELQSELANAQEEVAALLRDASSALGQETDASKLHSQIRGLVEEGKEVHSRHLTTTNELKSLQEELQSAVKKATELETELTKLEATHEENQTKLDKMTDKFTKSSRLVDELEEQLNSNFDSHRATNYRLSTLQTENVQARMELERQLEEQKLRNGQLEVSFKRYKTHTRLSS